MGGSGGGGANDDCPDDLLKDLLGRGGEASAQGGDFIQDSIDRRKAREANERLAVKFEEALKQTGKINALVQRAAKSSYRGTFLKEDYPLRRGFFTGYLGGTFGSLPLVFALGVATSPLCVPVMVGAVAAGATAGYKLLDEKPVRQFSAQEYWFAKSLKGLPDGPEKDLVRDFGATAKGQFLLGYAAALRTERGKCGSEGFKARRLERRIEALVGEAAKILKYDDASARSLKDEFSSGVFPSAREFAGLLDGRYRELDKKIKQKAENLRAAP